MSQPNSPNPPEGKPSPEIPLRARKSARTKVGLLRAAIGRLVDKNFAEITVKELCEEVQVSEATFFNYFKKKDDLLRYFVRLWSLEVSWHACHCTRPEGPAENPRRALGVIEAIFRHTGQDLAKCSRPMLEIIAHMALSCRRNDGASPCCESVAPEDTPLCLAEKVFAFPDLEGVDDIPEQKIDELIRGALTRAIDQRELPPNADVDAGVQALIDTFFGVPLWLEGQPERIPEVYARQLKLIFAGLQAP